MKKTLKIVLIVASLALAGTAIYLSIGDRILSGSTSLSGCHVCENIKKEIQAYNSFNIQNHSLIKFKIETNRNKGNISSSESESLLKILDAKQVTLLISHSNNVLFKRSVWPESELQSIEKEARRLMPSSPSVKVDLTKIVNVIAKYRQIQGFISQANAFAGITRVSSVDESYPESMAEYYIKQSKTYLGSLGVIANCSAITSALRGIPGKMYEMNYRFISNKINSVEGVYKNKDQYPTYTDYYNNVYAVIMKDIEDFENRYELFEVSFSNARSKILLDKQRVEKESNKAMTFFKVSY